MIFQFTREKKPAKPRSINAYILLIVSAAVITAVYFLETWLPSSPIVPFAALSLAVLIPGFIGVNQNNKLKDDNQLLQAQQQYLSNAVVNVSEGVIVTDSNENVYYMNPAAEQLTGCLLQNVQDKPLQHIYKIHNQNTGYVKENAATRVLKTGKSVVNENNTVLTNSRRQKIIISNSCNPLHTNDGGICGTVLVFKECKPSVNTTQTEQVYNTGLIQHLPHAVYTCDENGVINSYNNACVQIWGREPKLHEEKWCASQKMFYADGTAVEHQSSPIALAIRQKRSFEAAEIILQQHNGSRRNIIMYAAPLFNIEGEVTGAVNTLIDITEKNRSEQIARYNEDRYYTLVEQASEAIFITDNEGNLLETNMQASVITGYTKHELRDMNIAKLFPKDDFEDNIQVFKKLMAGSEKVTQELIAVHKNKHPLVVCISAKKLTDGRLMAIVNDITELKQTEKSLQESEQLNASILASTSTHVGVINEAGVLVTANKAWNDFAIQNGKTVLERCKKGDNFVTNIQLDAACGDKTAASVLEGFDAVRLRKIPKFEQEYVCLLAEEVRWFALRIYPFTDNASKVVITHVDITKRKSAENEMGNYRLALNESCIMDVADYNGVITDVNDNFCSITGFTKDEIIGQTHSILDAGYHPEGFYENMWSTIREGKVWAGEIKNRSKNGKTFWVSTTIIPCINTEGRPVQYISIRRDINQRKSAEEKMRNAVERFQFLAQATSDTIWDWDIESDKMLYNEAITPMLGYDKSEVNNINEWWKQNIHPDDIDDITKAIKLAVAEKKQNLQLEYRFKCENGAYKFIYDRAFILYNTNGKASRMIGAMQDVTYQKEEEHRINNAVVDAQEAERQYLGMELHDNINQLLTGTLLMLSAAAHVKMDGKEVLKLAEKCKDHLTNAVEEIRNLSHRLSPAAFTTSLQQEFVFLITQMSATAGFAAIHNLNISNEKTIPAEIKICLYRILQEQLSNICKHAKAQKVSVTLIQASNKVFLKIADDGVGFNPKEITQGIGLSNIKKRVGYFSGRFNLTAAAGKGCSIDVELPYQHNTTAL